MNAASQNPASFAEFARIVARWMAEQIAGLLLAVLVFGGLAVGVFLLVSWWYRSAAAQCISLPCSTAS